MLNSITGQSLTETQVVFQYISCQAEVLAKGVGKTECLPTFTNGSMPDGSATIDEFIREGLGGSKAKEPWKTTTTAGRTKLSLPDLVLTSDELKAAGYKGGLSPSILFPNKFKKGNVPSYKTFMKAFQDSLSSASAKKSWSVTNIVNHAADVLEYVEKARQAENAKWRSPFIESQLKGLNQKYVGHFLREKCHS